MPQLTVKFQRCHQDSQDYGSNDEHMVSRVFFVIEVDGEPRGQFHADLKQTVGSEYETGPIEVGQPVGYSGPFNHEQFSKAASEYFRKCVGSAGRGIRISGGTDIRMRDNVFDFQHSATFDVSGAHDSW